MIDKSVFTIYCPQRNLYLMEFEEGSNKAGCWTNKKQLWKEFDFLPQAFRVAKKIRAMGKNVHIHYINQFGIKMRCKLNFDKKTSEAVTEFYGFSGLINQMNADIIGEEEEREERYMAKLILSEYASRQVIFKHNTWKGAIDAAFKAAAEDGRDIMRIELSVH